jgi:ATP-dependent Clp protease ATP-binding subunit ClpA
MESLAAHGRDGHKIRAWHLKRAIERHLVYPLASLLATDQVMTGETISVDWNGMPGSDLI